MKLQRIVIKYSLLFLLIFCFSCISAQAVPSLTAAASGLCCAKNTLQETTEKQCKQVKGKYYSAKKKALAQKECRSLNPKPVVQGKNTVPGFCCTGSVVKKTTQKQCSKMKGSFYVSSALAKKSCKPKKIFCCNKGKVNEILPAECKKRKGIPYKSVAEAKKKCKPADIYCCIEGKTTKTSPKQCTQRKGTAYKTTAEAKKRCQPSDIFCCVEGKIKESSPKQCAQQKGTAYKTTAEAKRKCKQKLVYCCIDGELNSLSSKECRKEKGKEYRSKLVAEKICRSNKGTSEKRSSAAKGYTGKRPDLPTVKPGLVAQSGNAVHLARPKARIVDSKVAQFVNPEKARPSQSHTGNNTGAVIAGVVAGSDALEVTATGPDWTTVSGVASDQTLTTIFSGITHVLAQRIGSPSPASNIRNIIYRLNPGPIDFSIDLPPDSTWLIQAVVKDPLMFNIIPFSITTSATREAITRNAIIEPIEMDRDRINDYYTGWQCNFSGRVTVNGNSPVDNFFLRLTRQDESSSATNMPLSRRGAFSFRVAPGHYSLQPHSMTLTAYDNTIAAQEYICAENWDDEIIVNFDYTQPELSIVSGRVLNNGQPDARIRALTLLTADGSAEPFTFQVPSGEYRLELPRGKQYYITPIVPEQWDPPSRHSFFISLEQSERVINIEVFQPEYELGYLTQTRIKQNPGGVAPSIKITFQTLLIGGDKEKYDKSVRITSPAKPQWNVISNCAFRHDANNTCTMDISTDGFNLGNDSLHAQIIGLEDVPGSSMDYTTPFRNIAGDLTMEHGGALTIDRAQNSSTFRFDVKNRGPGNSNRCNVSIKINQREAVNIAIPVLEMGESHRINKHIATNIDTGDTIVFQINNDCDNDSPENNTVSMVIEDHDSVDHSDHDPVDEGDHTEQVRMTGEGQYFWESWFD